MSCLTQTNHLSLTHQKHFYVAWQHDSFPTASFLSLCYNFFQLFNKNILIWVMSGGTILHSITKKLKNKQIISISQPVFEKFVAFELV